MKYIDILDFQIVGNYQKQVFWVLAIQCQIFFAIPILADTDTKISQNESNMKLSVRWIYLLGIYRKQIKVIPEVFYIINPGMLTH